MDNGNASSFAGLVARVLGRAIEEGIRRFLYHN